MGGSDRFFERMPAVPTGQRTRAREAGRLRHVLRIRTKPMRRIALALGLIALVSTAPVHSAAAQRRRAEFTHADTLRGSNGPGRSWWDASFYDLHVAVSPTDSSIRGYNAITYRVLKPADRDADRPAGAARGGQHGAGRQAARRIGATATRSSWRSSRRSRAALEKTITVYYHGKPRAAKRPPWDGGFIWQQRQPRQRAGSRRPTRDSARACGGRTRTILADEPDSQRIAITVPDSMIDVSNGRLRERRRTTRTARRRTSGSSSDPINNYDVEVNAGQYAHCSDTFNGEKGTLTLDFWPLAYHADTAKVQFQAGEVDARVLRALVRPVPVVQGRLQADRGAAPRHGASERRGVRQQVQERLPRPRSLRHRRGAQVGLHHRARERARMVGQQHHGEGRGRHVDPRGLRELLRRAVRRMPGREGGGRASTSSEAGATSGTTRRSSARTA